MENIKCLICHKHVAQCKLEDFGNGIPEDSPGTSSDCDFVRRQLSIVLLLRKFLDVPQEICSQLLKEHGHPNTWFFCCDSCSKIISDAKVIYKQILSLEEQLQLLKTEFEKGIISSSEPCLITREDPLKLINNDEKSKSSSPTEIIRSFVFRKNRDFVTVKSEQEELPDNEENNLSENICSYEQSSSSDFDSPAKPTDSTHKTLTKVKLGFRQQKLNKGICSSGKTSNSYSLRKIKKPSYHNEAENVNLPSDRERDDIDIESPDFSDSNLDHSNDSESSDCDKNEKRKICSKLENEDRKKFQCEVCLGQFSRYYYLRRHYLKNHGKLQYSCKICDTKLLNQTDIQVHNLKFHKPDASRFSCKICDRSYRFSSGLRSHMRQFHKGQRISKSSKRLMYTHICEICNKYFKFNVSLKIHLKNEHIEHFERIYPEEEDKKVNYCDKCQLQLKNTKSFKDHYRLKHPEEVAAMFPNVLPFVAQKCPLCDYTTKHFNMKVHLRSHKNERPYVCDICGKDFTLQQYLKHHQNSEHYEELGLQPFACPHCGKKFRAPATLRGHIKAIHEKEFAFCCKVCNQGFIKQSLFVLHMKRHTGDKSVMCDQCGSKFVSRSELSSHIRSAHTDTRGFSCQQCPKAFKDATHLKRHVQGVHCTGVKPYHCQICQKKFPVRNYLYIHMRSHKKRGEIPE